MYSQNLIRVGTWKACVYSYHVVNLQCFFIGDGNFGRDNMKSIKRILIFTHSLYFLNSSLFLFQFLLCMSFITFIYLINFYFFFSLSCLFIPQSVLSTNLTWGVKQTTLKSKLSKTTLVEDPMAIYICHSVALTLVVGPCCLITRWKKTNTDS